MFSKGGAVPPGGDGQSWSLLRSDQDLQAPPMVIVADNG